MVNADLTPNPSMVHCPKCGFEQPSDQYCAQCGIDMYKLQKNPASLIAKALKKPVVLVLLAIVAVIFTAQGVRSLRKPAQNFAGDSRSQELRARVSERASGNSGSSERSQLNSTGSASTNSDEASSENLSSTSSQISDTANLAPASPASTSTSASASGAPQPAKTALSGAVAAEPPELQVTFAWAEASREWLQAMGATTPGLHRIAELDSKLRESVGGYRILEVTRQKLTDKAATTTLIHGDRLSIRFESTAANDSTLTGSIQPAMRGADGSVRSPAAAAVSIDKGQGSIVTLGAPAAPIAGAGATSPTGAEIVLLILPRWGANRNP